jgi:hypothetical protein
MRSVTPVKTAEELGWRAARRSLIKVISRTAPKPARLSRFYWKYPSSYRGWFRQVPRWIRDWILWVPRTIKLWFTVKKHEKTHAAYIDLAKQGVDSRTIFKATKRRMHLTEDEIFAEGNRIMRGERLPEFKRKEIEE